MEFCSWAIVKCLSFPNYSARFPLGALPSLSVPRVLPIPCCADKALGYMMAAGSCCPLPSSHCQSIFYECCFYQRPLVRSRPSVVGGAKNVSAFVTMFLDLLFVIVIFLVICCCRMCVFSIIVTRFYLSCWLEILSVILALANNLLKVAVFFTPTFVVFIRI